MKIVELIDEDFINYKKASMVIGCPFCSFKCDKECGKPVCQNGQLANARIIDVFANDLAYRYISNDITDAIVFQGLEPFDSWTDSCIPEFISIIRNQYKCHDDIVIYTGYNEDEVEDKVNILKKNFDNIIIKFGRYIPDQESHYDKVLGVNLASPNQYAKKIS